MDLLINLFDCIGLHVRGGFAAICHTPKPPIDLTCEPLLCPFTLPIPNFPNVTELNVENLLMNQFDCIMKEIGMGHGTYQRTGLEEIMAELYWRYPFALNQDRKDWLQILAIPYIEGGFSFSAADERNTNELYNVGLGNDKHLAAGFCAGICLDFLSTVEIGGEIGYRTPLIRMLIAIACQTASCRIISIHLLRQSMWHQGATSIFQQN